MLDDWYWAGTDPNDQLEDGSGTTLVAGSLSVDERIAGKQPDAAKPYYNGFRADAYPRNTPLTNIVFTLNTDCWLYGVDLSYMSIWSDFFPLQSVEPLTLISPIHVLSASHVTPTNGTRVVFRSLAGDLFARTLVDSKPIHGVATDDLCVGILNEPLPSDILAAKFLPPGYSAYIGNGRKMPYVRIGGYDKTCNIHDVVCLSPTTSQSRMMTIEPPTDTIRRQYHRPAYAMDSGHPICILLGTNLAYLCPAKGYYEDGQVTGFLCVRYLRLVQKTMDFLSDVNGLGRASLQTFDLSCFQKLQNAGGLE